VGIQFGAGGATPAAQLHAEGTHDPQWAIRQARRFLEAGAHLIMIESQGITENVAEWRTDAVAALANGLGPERVMFDAADPEVFSWYVKTYGPEVNLFVDHSQIVQIIKPILCSSYGKGGRGTGHAVAAPGGRPRSSAPCRRPRPGYNAHGSAPAGLLPLGGRPRFRHVRSVPS
jgi:hypothetical protein